MRHFRSHYLYPRGQRITGTTVVDAANGQEFLMRYMTVVAVSMLAPFVMLAQGAQDPIIAHYQVVTAVPATPTQWLVTYHADLVNPGGALGTVTATVTSVDTLSIRVAPGQGTLDFGPVPANSQVTSRNTFSIFGNYTAGIDFGNLKWTFPVPLANPGANQTAGVGGTVTLDGSGSTNPSGIGTLAYSWAFTMRPAGSTAVLTSPGSVMPTFVTDVPGDYIIKLTVNNGVSSSSSSVTVTTTNTPPVANAGPNQTVPLGATVILNGSGSSDVGGNPLTYSWAPISGPDGSAATLTGAKTLAPTFVADKPGAYVVQLIVNNGTWDSAPANVTVTTQNSPPVANVGPNQVVNVGSLVQLNGSRSTDVDGNPLTYQWSLITFPAGSIATLNNPVAVNPTFTADLPGTYVAQLIVNDGNFNSAPAAVTITTNAVLAPTANAGLDQFIGEIPDITLSGTGVDPQGLPLALQWALINKPAGSTAALSGTDVANPTFFADLPGSYVAQLIVNNGTLSSAPSTVTITTANVAPVANAGPNQNVTVGASVTLDGSGSSDADHDPMTYSWSLISLPADSVATLSGANTISPTFVADVAGAYVVQLIASDGFTCSAPATVMITASLVPSITLTPDPLNLGTSVAGTLTVMLSAPAGAGGQLVSLSSLGASVASVAPTVFVPENVTGANVTVMPGNTGSTTITASANGFVPQTATVNVAVLGISLWPPTAAVDLSRTIAGVITLTVPAPPGGVAIMLSAPGGIVDLEPPSVPITAGTTIGAFTMTGLAEGTTIITASSPGYYSGSANVSVRKLGQISLGANMSVGLGQSAPLQVSLATAAPAGGITVTLTSSDTSRMAVAPAAVFIKEGSTVPVTQPQISGINIGSATISASAPGFGPASQVVQVTATISISPESLTVTGTATQNLVLNLPAAAPAGGLIINLTSSNPAVATVPATVTFAANTTSVTVPVTGVGIGSAVIHASALPSVADTTASVTVTNPGGAIQVSSNASVGVGQSTAFSITLPAAAPAGGITVTLASSDASKVSVTPASVFIAAGSTTPAIQPQVSGINFGSATISASAPGFTSASQAVQVTAALSFLPGSLTITGTATQNLSLNLSAPAPAGGLIVNLSSSNPAVATVPATVTFAANATSVSVPVTGVGIGPAVIHASALPSVADTTASVTVANPGGAIQVSSNGSVGLGQSVAFSITLPAAAPAGGITVTLASSDPSKVSVTPASVIIAAGSTTPATQPQVKGMNLGSATISASATGLTSASQAVQVTAAVSFLPASLTITGTATQNLSLNLSAPAPAGGLTLNLSSSNSTVATVPATVAFAANATSVTVPVTGAGIGSAVIHASALPSVADTTASVTVTNPGSIQVSSNASVGLGQSVAFSITLPAAAPAGGITVTLASSDPSKVSVTPASVIIAAGSTTPATQPQVKGINFGSAIISASAPGFTSASQAVQVTAALSFLPASLTITGTATQNLSLNLSAPAPAGGLTINLNSSNSAAATVPGTLAFAANATSMTVPVMGVGIGSAVIHASALPSVGDTTASVTVVSPGTILVSSNASVGLGQSVPFPITLPAAAPAGGITVTLASSDPSKVSVTPASVIIAAGSTTPATQPQVKGINFGSAIISASAPGFTSASQAVQVTAAVSFLPVSLTITGIAVQNLSLNLSAPAPAGGLTINLSSSNSGVAIVPATVTFAANATNVTVPVTGVGIGSAAIHASALPSVGDTTASVTVVSPGTILVSSNASVGLGQSVPFPITLPAAAPAGGITVTLASSDPSKVSVTPASVFIATGSTTPATQPQVNGINFGSAIISASAPGFTSASQPVQVTATIRFSPDNVTLIAAATQNLILNLPAPAPAGGLIIDLSSSNPAVATVPAMVTFAANASSVTVPVTGVAVGSAVIHASALPSVAATTASVTVTPAPDFILPAGVTVAPGESVPFQVTLVHPAPAGGVIVTLASSDTSTLAVSPSNIIILAGDTSPSTAPRVNGVNFGSAIVSAFAYGLNPGSATVQVTATIAFSPAALTFSGTGTQNTFLNLSTPAPAGGLTVSLSSSNTAVATVPPSVSFAASATSVTVPVTGVGAGSATIHASALPNVPDTTASVTVVVPGTIGLPANLSVGLGQSASFAVTLGTPAPAGGVTVSLASSDTSKVTVVPTAVSIPEAATAPATQPQVTGVNVGSAKISASAPGYTSASQTVTVVSGVAATITATRGGGQSAQVNSAFANPLVATVNDAGSNPVAGVTVTFTGPASGPGVGTVTAVTNAAGVATATVTANATAGGPYTVNATVPGLATPATYSLTNIWGAAATITATSGGGQSTQVNTAFANPLVATVKDAGSNPVPGVTVTFTGPASGASITTVTAVTNAAGVATATVTANAAAGSPYTVNATAPGVAAPATYSLTNTTGPPGTITATSGGGQNAQVNTAFANPLVATVKDAGSNPVAGVTVTFTGPASGASITMVTVVTNASGVATAAVTANATTGGPYTVNATVPGVAAPATYSLTNTTGPPGTITATSGGGQNAQVNTAFANPLVATVKDAGSNPVGGVTVTFTGPASGASIATVTAVTNAAGVATAAVTANAAVGGPYTVNATVPGVAAPATYSLTNTTGPPGTITATSGGGQSAQVNAAFANPLVATVKDAVSNPVAGVMVTFTGPASGASIGTVTAVTNAAGVATAAVTANATAGGPYTVNATVPGVATAATYALTNSPIATLGSISVSSTSVGQNLQTSIAVNISQPTGTTLQVTVTSSDPSKAVLAARPQDSGTGTVTATIEAGANSTVIFVQGRSSSGTALITASAPNYSSGTGTVTLTPSGFLLGGPNGVGASFTANQGVTTPLTVFSARLDSSFNFAENQPLSPGVSASVPVTSSNTSVGTITGSPLLFNAGDQSATTQFNALGAGSTILTAVAPVNFGTPAQQANQVLVNVNPTAMTIVPSSVTVGKNLETSAQVNLTGVAPGGGLVVTLTSADTSQLLLSSTPDGVGSGSLSLTIPAGLNHTQGFYLQGLGNSGNVTYTASAGNGFGSTTGTVTLLPSGFIIAGPGGPGAPSFFTSTASGNTVLTVYAAQLDSSGNVVGGMPVRGGFSANIAVTSSNTAAGTIKTSPVTIGNGDFSATTEFQPAGPGNSTLSVTEPAGFTTPLQDATVTAMVSTAGLTVTNASIGQFLESQGSVIIGAAAPAGGLPVTLTSNSTQLMVSATATSAGAASITITIPAGSNNASFYLQAFGGAGTVTYTASSAGFQSGTGSVSLTPSGVIIRGPGFAPSFSTTTTSGPSTLTVFATQLDSGGNPLGVQPLAGGISVIASLASDNPTVATVTTPVTITGGNDNATAQFTPKSVGTAKITVVTPAGWTPAPTSFLTVTGNVTQ